MLQAEHTHAYYILDIIVGVEGVALEGAAQLVGVGDLQLGELGGFSLVTGGDVGAVGVRLPLRPLDLLDVHILEDLKIQILQGLGRALLLGVVVEVTDDLHGGCGGHFLQTAEPIEIQVETGIFLGHGIFLLQWGRDLTDLRGVAACILLSLLYHIEVELSNPIL